MKSLILFLVATVFIIPISVFAEECPSDVSQLEVEVGKIKNCSEAYEFMSKCGCACTADIRASAVAMKTCESGFLSKLSASEKRKYNEDLSLCLEKYKSNKDGSIYRSAEAFCKLAVAKRYFDKFNKK